MPTNIAELGSVYKRIFVLGMVERLKDCGIVWNKITSTQYSTELSIDNALWIISLVRMPNQSSVTLNFVRNNKFFYSVSSDDDADVGNLFSEIEEYDIIQKDDALLQDLQQLPGCGPKIYNVAVVPAGVLASGLATKQERFGPSTSGGALAGGSST